ARLAQHRRALFVRLGRPGPLRLGRARRGLAHVGGVGHPDAPELTSRGGLDDGSLASAARAPTIEEQLAGPGLRLEKVHGALLFSRMNGALSLERATSRRRALLRRRRWPHFVCRSP